MKSMSDFFVAYDLNNMPLGSIINASINYKLTQRCLKSTLTDCIL